MAVAIDKYVCPFCGQKTLFVGVHDDEGNYKGRPGCDYESNSWSGLCYAIHHDGWGDCILCTDAHDLPLGGCFFDTEKEALEAIPTLTPPNEWVSVEERLPEYNPGTGAKSYWVAKKDNAGNWQMKIAQYCDYGYAMTMDAETEVTWRDWDFTKIANVTHWMLLPAPPDRRLPEGEEDT